MRWQPHRGVAQSASALRLGRRGRRFDPPPPDLFLQALQNDQPVSTPFLSLIIPAHNEAGHLPASLEAVNRYISSLPLKLK